MSSQWMILVSQCLDNRKMLNPNIQKLEDSKSTRHCKISTYAHQKMLNNNIWILKGNEHQHPNNENCQISISRHWKMLNVNAWTLEDTKF